jgi:hypothetical protein
MGFELSNGWRCYVYGKDTRHKVPHCHVIKGDLEIVIALGTLDILAINGRVGIKTIKMIRKIIGMYSEELNNEWKSKNP